MSGLEQYIDEIGGKLGGLQYFLDNQPSLAAHIVDQILLKQGESLTDEHRSQLAAAGARWNANSFIVRTSEPTDFKGMVGVMTTRSFIRDSELDETIEAVRAKARKKNLLEYAAAEGLGYDPNRVTTAVAPIVSPFLNITVTEHPNQRDYICLVDLSLLPLGANRFSLYGREDVRTAHRHDMAFDCRDNNIVYSHESLTYGLPYEEIVKQCLELRIKIRETGALPNDSLQYEMGIHEGRAILFQLKKFSGCQYSDYQLPRNSSNTTYRTFGLTPPQGIDLPVCKSENINGFHLFEKSNPDTDYIFSAPHPNAGGDQEEFRMYAYPTGMKGWIPSRKPSLGHDNTRFAILCLQRNGVVILDRPLWEVGGYDEIDDGDTVHIVCDGTVAEISKSF